MTKEKTKKWQDVEPAALAAALKISEKRLGKFFEGKPLGKHAERLLGELNYDELPKKSKNKGVMTPEEFSSLLHSKGYKISEMARLTGLKPGLISNCKNGNQKISAEIVNTISAVEPKVADGRKFSAKVFEELILERGYTLKKLSEITGLSRTTLTKAKTGHIVVTGKIWDAVYGVSPSPNKAKKLMTIASRREEFSNKYGEEMEMIFGDRHFVPSVSELVCGIKRWNVEHPESETNVGDVLNMHGGRHMEGTSYEERIKNIPEIADVNPSLQTVIEVCKEQNIDIQFLIEGIESRVMRRSESPKPVENKLSRQRPTDDDVDFVIYDITRKYEEEGKTSTNIFSYDKYFWTETDQNKVRAGLSRQLGVSLNNRTGWINLYPKVNMEMSESAKIGSKYNLPVDSDASDLSKIQPVSSTFICDIGNGVNVEKGLSYPVLDCDMEMTPYSVNVLDTIRGVALCASNINGNTKLFPLISNGVNMKLKGFIIDSSETAE